MAGANPHEHEDVVQVAGDPIGSGFGIIELSAVDKRAAGGRLPGQRRQPITDSGSTRSIIPVLITDCGAWAWSPLGSCAMVRPPASLSRLMPSTPSWPRPSRSTAMPWPP